MTDQASQRPPALNAAFLVMGLGRRTQAELETMLGAIDLSYRHLSALGHLSADAATSYSELARRAGITVQSMQTTIGQLEARGLVVHDEPAGQGRRARLRLTRRGRERLEAGREALIAAEAALLAPLKESERAAVRSALGRMFVAAVEGSP